MTRLIFITKLIVLTCSVCAAQTVSPDSLLAYEYRYFNTIEKEAKETALIGKINYYLRNNYTGKELFNEINRIDPGALEIRLKNKFLWNAALISYINNETAHARLYIEQYGDNSRDSSVDFHLLSLLINKYTDTVAVRKHLNFLAAKDYLFAGLNCFYTISNYSRKHLNLYLLSSAIIPGSGTAMNGYPLKGLVSLAIMAGSVYGVVKLIEYGLYVNAVLWSTGVGLKFYTGNIRLTEQSFNRAESRKKNKLTNDCELTLKKILDKYPLTLQEL